MAENQSDTKPKRDPTELFGGKRFDIEHALNMYATSFVLMPAFGIYEEKIVAAFKPQLAKCHIYVIGTMPAIETVDHRLEDERLVIGILVAGKRHELAWPMPESVDRSRPSEAGSSRRVTATGRPLTTRWRNG